MQMIFIQFYAASFLLNLLLSSEQLIQSIPTIHITCPKWDFLY